jgi:hypothetical protein
MAGQNQGSTIVNAVKRVKKNVVVVEIVTSMKPRPKAATKQLLQDRTNNLEDKVSRLRGK